MFDKVIIIFIVNFFIVSVSAAETIFLRSGKVWEGEITEKKNNGNIIVNISGFPVEFFYDDILGVKKEGYDEFLENTKDSRTISPRKVVVEYCELILKNDFKGALQYLSNHFSI